MDTLSGEAILQNYLPSEKESTLPLKVSICSQGQQILAKFGNKATCLYLTKSDRVTDVS